jgi:peptide/nickel transport system ATP-binding protein
MQVCPLKEPVRVTTEHGARVACWLHGPAELIPPDGTQPLAREEIAIADEA